NDVYVVDDGGDGVVENPGEGNDAVFSTVHYVLPAEVETLVLQGSADLQGYGNSLANSLYGTTGSNLLDPHRCPHPMYSGDGTHLRGDRAGPDAMYGGAGNDTYLVDNPGDMIVENLNEGTDAVFATIGQTLAANVETLVLQGSGDLSGTGNALANSIYGNAGN